MKEFKVNEYITLKLENGLTYIYIKGKRFLQCIRLMLNITKNDVELFDEIDSIDEAAELYSKTYRGAGTTFDQGVTHDITPEQEFWGHCSNLQTWAENNYNSKFLRFNLAFPLLKEIADSGDLKAEHILKEEIFKRFESGYKPVIDYLIIEGYLKYFNRDEFEIFKPTFKIIYPELSKNSLDIIIKLSLIFRTGFKIQKNDLPLHFELVPRASYDADGKIKELSLNNLKMKKIPEEIFHLSDLENLDLSNNNIKDLPKSIEKLTSLKYLNLSNNNLIKLPEVIGNLYNLVDLDLTKNNLTDLPHSLFKISSLKRLDISQNKSLSIALNYYTSMKDKGVLIIPKYEQISNNVSKYLTIGKKKKKVFAKDGLLNLRNRNIHNLEDVHGLEHFDFILELNLSYNNLSKIKKLENLKELRTLYLYDNNIIELEGFEKLGKLEYLHLSNNKIHEIRGLGKLKNLKYLFLRGNIISEIHGLEKLKNLIEIDFGKNTIDKIEGLDELSKLESLDLSFNNISRIEGLKKLKKLKTLKLYGNHIYGINGLENLTCLKYLWLPRNPLINHIINELGGLRPKAGYVKEPQKFVEYCKI